MDFQQNTLNIYSVSYNLAIIENNCRSIDFHFKWTFNLHFILFYFTNTVKFKAGKIHFTIPEFFAFFSPTNWVVSHFQVFPPISLGKCNFMLCNTDLHSCCERKLISLLSGQTGETLLNYLMSVIFSLQTYVTFLGME